MNGTRVFIAVGSNDMPDQNLKSGIRLLKEILTDISVSECYQSISRNGGADYLNLVITGITSFKKPDELVVKLKEIEKVCGRIKNTEHRCALDLDLLLFGEYSKAGIYPHPDLFNYSFVAVPFRNLLGSFSSYEFNTEFFQNIQKKTYLVSAENLTSVFFSADIE